MVPVGMQVSSPRPTTLDAETQKLAELPIRREVLSNPRQYEYAPPYSEGSVIPTEYRMSSYGIRCLLR